ncbi:MAG: inosine monophosphate cyclohydrolase [Dehalococcoidia bacterium]|nr:inosine monophosphate cyclohydrolase [Dehalococcoidia bacterium]
MPEFEDQSDRIETSQYTGRGIVIGATPNGSRLVQVYWLTGRSEGSRNRIFIHEGDTVRTWVFDESKVENLELVSYHPIRVNGPNHIVTNGDQTDTIDAHLADGGTFESALDTRTWEPDPPIKTPRISGLVNTNDDTAYTYKLGILKTVQGNANHTSRHYATDEAAIPGYGHCITTYLDDGDPVPSFEGEPYPVSLLDTLEETANRFWNLLDEDNRVALLTKFIDPSTNESEVHIINRYGD